MFAFAIWDALKRGLFLARDRLGIKPLYYAKTTGGPVFGSEIKALVEHPAISPDLDEEVFFHYLTFVCTPVPRRMFAEIQQLGPAERLTARPDDNMRSEQYWSPLDARRREALAQANDEELSDRLIQLLRGSIEKRMMADVPFGCSSPEGSTCRPTSR